MARGERRLRRSRRRARRGSLRQRILLTVVALVLGGGIGLVVAGVPDVTSLNTDTPLITVGTTAPALPASTTTTAPTVSIAPTAPSTAATTTTSAPADEVMPLPERSTLTVVVANGARLDGAAAEVARTLRAAGYGEVLAVNTGRSRETVVYVAVGLEAVADRLVEDLGELEVAAVLPLAQRPATVPNREGDVVVVIGRP